MRKYTLCFFLMMLLFITAKADSITCKLKGTIFNRTSKTLLLLKVTDDDRGGGIHIPIINNQFEYTLDANEVEAYQLVFEDEHNNGAWTPIIFFPDNKSVEFTLYPQDIAYEKDVVKGGLLNSAYAAYKIELAAQFNPKLAAVNRKRKELEDRKDYNSIAYDSLMSRLNRAKGADLRRPIFLERDRMYKAGDDLTENGKKVHAETQAILDERDAWRYDYMRKNPSLVSYYLLLQDTYYNAREKEKIADYVKEIFPLFAILFPGHIYTNRLNNEVAGLNLRKPGQLFVDFTAPDLAGNSYTFSKMLNGKVTLLDLWGSWCGPCMAATRTMRPVYDEFKDKGLQVIGVAREFKETKALKAALKREKYPWINLVDLDDQHEVWSKYNISNSGGSIFLFDKDGKILAVNPTAEEVKKILVTKL